MDGSFEEGKALARYAVLKTLGRGSFGEVLKARDTKTGKVVALKRIFTRGPQDRIPINPIRELNALQSIQHPNVVGLLTHIPQEKGGCLTLVLECCSFNLADAIQETQRRLPEAVVKTIFYQILCGLAATHAAGVLHRDLKPSNVLFAADGTIKIADFGMARFSDPAPGAQYTHTVATRWYRAPELLFGAREYSSAVDVWAAGCMLAELLGQTPLLPGESDIGQLGLVVEMFGTINEETWPGVSELPDFKKINFFHAEPVLLAETLPDASSGAIGLLERLLQVVPERRCTAREALEDEYFSNIPLLLTPRDALLALGLPRLQDM